MASHFVVGNVVRLKSGGPIMTIEEINGRTIYCVWYKPDEFLRNHFPIESLIIYKAPTP
jgi:uncharacterized protein YodC (DUF2158 family)